MKKNKQNLSIFEMLRLPLIALAVIASIYGGLLIRDLKSQVNNLKNENQVTSFKTTELSNKLNQLENQANSIKTTNDTLSASLSEAQKQIIALQTEVNVKKVAVKPTITYVPTVVTKTITQTVTQEVDKKEAIQATVTIQNVGSFKVDLQAGDNAFAVLKRASEQNSFPLKYDSYSFGVFVNSIGGIAPAGNQYWAFYFNGTFSNVGASDQPVTKGDSIFWQLASF
ncbi:TPA: DUF4430 domain-containing protein [Candidatus Berkelbacteria bacterium]|uniref:Transcobalamin-like C-terminal domain-containing protein n=1 Tax=Berkelbacteria bacterium GW2011_GWE1_39_12 TaxID=1618337 RepID=A0A0G4B1J9_9BACT|nr:MAG: hypothetical protein UT28_C0001G0012 [Berkelbacteria bacterium GW2011_GWE1_39_12]HBO60079.1 DUF4430 domain-containing protein [Candidatus Berkelbacteria bacterium]